jgi:signal transduction histidine kinase
LNNTVKFTERRGRIAIASSDDRHGRMILNLRSDGIGMTTDVLERLFQLFEQGTEITRRYGGVGMGMAIAKALVEIHAGTISAGPGMERSSR